MLDDRRDPSGCIAHDASVPVRGIDVRREHRRGGAARRVRVNEPPQRFGAQQRYIARQQDDGAACVRQAGFRLQHGMSGAQLRLLQCKAQAQPFPERLLHGFRLMSDDHRRRGGLERIGGAEDVVDQGQTGHAM